MPPNWLLLNAARNQLLLKLGGFNRLTVQKKSIKIKLPSNEKAYTYLKETIE
jgi:hypothetical protein